MAAFYTHSPGEGIRDGSYLQLVRWFVWLISFIWFISFISCHAPKQPDKRNKPDKRSPVASRFTFVA
jgi:hypothetical protein